jgi:23S rRNA (cytosine1962-C5)-methyltransferase
MTKPSKPKPETTQAAPWGARAKNKTAGPVPPRAPLNQSKQAVSRGPQRENPPVARPSRPDSPAKPYSKPKPSASPAPVNRSAQPNRQRSGVIGATINRRAADRLRAGHLWVYASDIEHIEAGPGEPPALLSVADSRGLLLGTALYSPASQIALRLVSREALDEAAWLGLLESRLRMAVDRRRALLTDQIDSCRLCFSEADELPGLIVDKYGDLIILQLLTKGLDKPAVRTACVRVLQELLKLSTILERPDPRMRELEGLAAPDLTPLWAAGPTNPITSTQFKLNGLLFHFDANAGQKTGAFLDQSANYYAAQQWAASLAAGGRALDVCTYQGGFALHLARVCNRVTGIDSSRASLEVAERNLSANRAQLTGEVDWVEADAFQILRDWSDAGETFDTIVLDPPAFAKSQRAVEGALRGYKELNLRALRMARPGGLLITFSCSHHVGWADLEGAVTSAAADAHRRVRLRQRRGAAADHPVILGLPETEYLKCLVMEVE